MNLVTNLIHLNDTLDFAWIIERATNLKNDKVDLLWICDPDNFQM